MSSSPTQKFHEAFNEEGRPLGRLIPFSIIEKGSPDQQTLASSVAFLETQALSFDEVLRGFRDNKTLLKNLRVSRKCEKHLPLLAFYLKQTKVTFELVHGVSLHGIGHRLVYSSLSLLLLIRNAAESQVGMLHSATADIGGNTLVVGFGCLHRKQRK